MTVVDTALLPAMLDAARAMRQQFAACCAEFAGNDASPDTVASAMARHLAKVAVVSLPPAAQLIWRDRVARPLRADAEKPLAERAVGAIRSWPSQRVGELQSALVEIDAILEIHENELAHEVIYTEISRTYS